MYRCKECGAEFDIKPDYCDCGNDEFELVELGKNNFSEETRKVDIDETEIIKEKSVEQIPHQKVQTAPETVYYTKPSDITPKHTVDSASLTVFILCILLSIYVIFFAWNPTEEDVIAGNPIAEQVVSENIPSVDKIWNNTPPKAQPQKTEVQKPVENIINQILPQTQQKKEEPQKVQKQQTVQPKTTVVPLKKVNQSTKTKTTTKSAVQKTTTNTASQTSVQLQHEQQKKAAEAQAKQKAEQERKAAEAAQLKKLQEEQARKNAELKAKQEAANKQEFSQYKANLRNAIGRKVDFTKVIGDGSCTVAFKIDQNGKLINRSFAKQSTNNTLNDAVYSAVMSTPTFTPPPSGYKGEVFNLNIRFYNGNFEISLP